MTETNLKEERKTTIVKIETEINILNTRMNSLMKKLNNTDTFKARYLNEFIESLETLKKLKNQLFINEEVSFKLEELINN
jgi:hypothetical protein